MRKRTTRAVSVALGLLLAAPALATEGGGSLKPLGLDTIVAGILPSPGLQLKLVLGSYEADEYLDSVGKPRAGLSNVDLSAKVFGGHLTYVYPFQLWGAKVASQIAMPLHADVRLSFDAQTPGGALHRSNKSTGIGDLLLGPVMLGWHSPTYHQIVALDFYVPTGNYDKASVANTGRNYSAVSPSYRFTWFPQREWEVSGSLTYLANQTNKDTNYRSGNELAFDYGVGYTVNGWQFGAAGYLYKQVSDDKQNGQVVGDGNRGQVASIGPFLRYSPSPQWGITLKWMPESMVENKTRGNRVILQLMAKLF